ncbi:hypothetical protein PF005_g6353 [Phytophthora fragariae]|uniref:RxLR effector protein n=1 Tax=Phytophthora fragariae TaxID=53985 RepID=A0A6A3ULV5_9STRA|nr:hypothetical protein PF003_g27839 [Phytophthora fragariae]KAE8945573.1 hypothetical protein PF009_g4757 [Phytophthora fragariae]KAE9024698.1 hypothetical protein PF011_g3375 [Phytophthora fragariae]KAE9123748.1 hypothetical protein PF010_g6264 [Phytophthora fragariae]KAE9134466.1 hypothetical protein PF007_g2916 [Phytophthora fragariae]
MRLLRWFIVLGVLLGLSRAESQVIDNDVDDPVGDGSDKVKAPPEEAELIGEEETEQPGQEVDEGKATETTEASEERKLYPYEQQWVEAELRWQHDMEELEKREREEAMRDLDQVTDDNEHQNYPEEQYAQSDRVDEDNNNNDAYLENQRRLEKGSDQSADGNEEEVVPVVPGLTDVELFAFNVEFAKEEVLDKIIDWSYDQVAAMSRFRDNYIHVEDLYDFLLKTLNPLDEEIDEEDEQILTDAVTELRRQQGLVDKEQIVYRGFIARGMPLRFLQSLAHEMHQTVQKRRLKAREEL